MEYRADGPMEQTFHTKTEATKSGYPTLVYIADGKRQLLHSRRDPFREHVRFTEMATRSPGGLIVILGLGLGYHISPMLPDFLQAKKIIAIERIPDIMSQPVAGHVRKMIEDGTIEVLSGKTLSQITDFFSDDVQPVAYASLSVLRHPASYRIFNSYYARIEQELSALLDKQMSNRATINRFALPFFKNALFHISRIDRYHSLQVLAGCCAGKDVLVASSSPTLGVFLDTILKNRSRLVVIAVDSALPVLAGFGIRADFVVSVDPQPWIHEHLIGQTAGTAGIITVFTSALRDAPVPVFGALTSHPLLQIVESLYPGYFPSLSSEGGSVAGDALAAAVLMCPERIYLTGTDFCFPHNVMYARGSAYQNRYDFYKRNRFSPKERLNMDYVRAGSVYLGRWRTRRNFLAYRDGIQKPTDSIDIPVVYLREDGEEYGPAVKAAGSLDSEKPVIDYPVKRMLAETIPDIRPDPIAVLHTLGSEEVLKSVITHSHVPLRYAPKLLTIINNLLISVKK
ncbi:MAG: 6-hydroxymethylpterin diphosphokinase MptE-like protein [Spirochaetota bacterium]